MWQNLPKPFFILAPMEAVTDVVFRHVVTQAAAPDLFFTEFTNATGWAAAGDKAIGTRLVKTDDEHPIVAQLWGADPEAMTKLSLHCKELGYGGIDINMGCPDASAVKSGGGAGMIRTPELASAMIAAAKASGLPVSVKTRLGYSTPGEWQEWLGHLLRQDIANLTIHLRTKKEMSKVDAHFELIDDIKKLRDEIAPNTLLTINGDIRDRQHGEELIKKHGVDGIMIGRGIFHNPFAFEKTDQLAHLSSADLAPLERQRTAQEAEETVGQVVKHSKKELLDLLNLQLDLHDEYEKLSPRKFDPLKRFFKIYVREFDGAAELRDRLMHAKSTDEVRELLSN
jgi:tRNA-dihydrouridine synthase